MNIIFFQTWGIGDMIMSLPAIAALRYLPSQHTITVVSGSPAAAKIVQSCALADRVLVFRNSKIFFSSVLFFWNLRRFKFERAIVAYGLSAKYSLLLRWISGIPDVRNAGKVGLRFRGRGPRPHRALANLAIAGESLISQLPKIAILLEMPSHEVEKILDSVKDAKPLIGIHPGGGRLQKCKVIPKTILTKIVNWCEETYPGVKIVIILGPDEEAVAEDFENYGTRVVVVSGLSIMQTAAVISKTNAVLCGDTGIGHLAGLVGVPVLTLAGPTDADTTHPWGGRNIVLRAGASPQCAPCYYSPYDYKNCQHGYSCMHAFEKNEIISALNKLLAFSEGV